MTAISKPLIRCLLEPSKLFPISKYEEAQQRLNYALNDDDVMEALRQQLQFVSDKSDISDVRARRLVYRMANLLLEEIQVFIAKEMQESESVPVQNFQGNEMTDHEKDNFKQVLGSLLRSFFQKGLSKEAKSKMWRSVCRCLKETFIDEFVDSQSFLNKELWFNSDDPENSILIADNALNFFLFVDTIIRKSVVEINPLNFGTLDDALIEIHKSRRVMALWYSLTHNYFGEADSVYVMKLFVSSFRALSLRLEEQRRNEQALDKGKKSNALRTNLKRD